jgi:hypothetical protein
MVRRWRAHVRDAKKPSTGWCFSRAIRDHGPDAFSHHVLEMCATVEEANEAEVAWIASFSTQDPRYGFNVLAGGGQTKDSITEAVRQRMSAAVKTRWTDPKQRAVLLAGLRATLTSSEWRAARSAAAKAQWADPEIAAKNRAAIESARTPEVWARIAASQAVIRAKPEHRANLSAKAVDRWKQPAFREKTSVAIREAKARPEVRAKASAAAKSGVTDESRAKQRAAAKAQWDDPEARAKKVEAIKATRTPEMVASIAEHHKALFNTPEMKAKLSAAAQARVAASEEKRAAMRARPCSKCGAARVTLANGTVRCNVCHAKKERARHEAKRATLRGMPQEPTETMRPDPDEAPTTEREPFVPVFCPEMSPELPVPLFEDDGTR